MTQAAWESAAPKFKPTDSEVGAREQFVRQLGLRIGSGIAT